jgi:hypothetical protein
MLNHGGINMKPKFEITLNNGKYRIKHTKAEKDNIWLFSIPVKQILFHFGIEEYAILEEKKWFITTYWSKVEITNRSEIVKKWIEKYFDSPKKYYNL